MIAVLDTNKQVLAPTSQRRARLLLSKGKAAIFRKFPLTIILQEAKDEVSTPELKLKLDPGSKTTGVAVVNQASGQIVFAAEISHRGQAIKMALETRRSLRRGRRNRNTRYRQARFQNRRRPEGWLPPLLESRIAHVVTWVKRLRKDYPIKGIAQELVKFDLQQMEKPEISGIEYQQGTLAGYEVREYL